MKVGNDAVLDKSLTVQGETTLNGDASVGGALSVGADVSVQGGVTSIAPMNAPAFHQTSDYRLKSSVFDLQAHVVHHMMEQLRPKGYFMEDGYKMGFLAHELQQAIPSAVTGHKDGPEMQTVDYSQLIPVLVSYIQTQALYIQEMRERIASLEMR